MNLPQTGAMDEAIEEAARRQRQRRPIGTTSIPSLDPALEIPRIQFPKKLKPLFTKSRYKVLKGGRGGAKSWGIARALLLLGAKTRLRILCTREVQKSIKDSVHRLLEDQIELLGLGEFYEVLEHEIRGANGTEFIFSGLSVHTVYSIKSFEGVDIVWVEEAQAVKKKSWNILVPTIRKPGSEIWISFNPELDTDETYVRFWMHPPPDTIQIEMFYTDNPFFTKELEDERRHDELTKDKDEYRNIWEGSPLIAVAGAIYAKQVVKAVKEGRIRPLPYDPRLKVHTIWDLGWNDSMAIILVQRGLSDLRIIDYIEDDHVTLDVYAADLNMRRMNWGYDWLPHDGFTGDYKIGKSAYELLVSCGRRVKPPLPPGNRSPIPNISVESGIKICGNTFGQFYFDETKAARLVECAKRYKRNIPTRTGEPSAPVHDEYSHGADVLRYLALVADQLTNEEPDDYSRPLTQPFRPHDAMMGVLG